MLLTWTTGLRDGAADGAPAGRRRRRAVADLESGARTDLEAARGSPSGAPELEAALTERGPARSRRRRTRDRPAAGSTRPAVAAAVAPVHRMARSRPRTTASRGAAAEATARAADELGLLLVDDATLTRAVEEHRRRRGPGARRTPREHQLRTLGEELAAATARRTTLRRGSPRSAAERGALPARIAALARRSPAPAPPGRPSAQGGAARGARRPARGPRAGARVHPRAGGRPRGAGRRRAGDACGARPGSTCGRRASTAWPPRSPARSRSGPAARSAARPSTRTRPPPRRRPGRPCREGRAEAARRRQGHRAPARRAGA